MSNQRKQILAIINPISGTSSKEYVPEIINRVIDSTRFDVSIRFSQRPGHAALLTRQAIDDGLFAVLAVGGDGTVNEVASALRDSDTALGVIPCGSGNGLARHLGIPINIEKALQVINRCDVQPLDYGTVNQQPFFCTCGVGFDAHISQKFAKSHRRGPLTYVQDTIIEYLKYRSQIYTIEMQGKIITEKAFLIACGNASQYGNNAFITPHASMQDGLIDVTIIHPFTPLDTAILGLLLFTKHIDQDINIETYRTSELIIHRHHPGIMHLDGEPVMEQDKLLIKCHPAGIKIFLPHTVTDKKKNIVPIEDYFWNFINTIRGELNI